MTNVFIRNLYIGKKTEVVYKISICRNYVFFLQECCIYGFPLPFIAARSVIVFQMSQLQAQISNTFQP